MSSSATLHLDFHGIGVRLESELDAFARYAATTLQPFAAGGCDAPRVEARLQWIEGRPSRELRDSFGLSRCDRRPDRDVYVAGNTVYWLRIDDFEDFQLSAAWEDDRLVVCGRYYFRIGRGRGERLRRLIYRHRLDALRARRFSTLVYYLFYHPVLWLLSRERGWHVLHAAGVASGGGAAVLAGMPGCGKSTLATALLADHALTLQSDNLLLHDGARVWACPEPVLLDAHSVRLVGEARGRLTATGDRRVNGRDAYRPDRLDMDAAAPLAIVQVERAARSACTRIGAAECAQRIAAANWMAKEVRRIEIMARVLDLAADACAPDDRAALARLTAAAPCYSLEVAEGATPAAVVRDRMRAGIG